MSFSEILLKARAEEALGPKDHYKDIKMVQKRNDGDLNQENNSGGGKNCDILDVF